VRQDPSTQIPAKHDASSHWFPKSPGQKERGVDDLQSAKICGEARLFVEKDHRFPLASTKPAYAVKIVLMAWVFPRRVHPVALPNHKSLVTAMGLTPPE